MRTLIILLLSCLTCFAPPWSPMPVMVVKSSSIPVPSPVLWWPMTNSSGATVTDSSGNGNTLDLGNSPTWNSGYISFTGSSDQYGVTASDFAGLTSTNITIAFWCNFGGVADTPICELGQNFIDINGYAIWVNDTGGGAINGSLNFADSTGGGADYSGWRTPNGYNNSTWVYLTVTYTRSQTPAWYSNGISISVTQTSHAGTVAQNTFPNNQVLNIASRNQSGNYWTGSLANFKIWNSNLTSSQVLQDYKNSLPAP